MRIASIQIGKARKLKAGGRTVLSAIGKQDLVGAVPVMPLGLLGDEQADLSVHGGLEPRLSISPETAIVSSPGKPRGFGDF